LCSIELLVFANYKYLPPSQQQQRQVDYSTAETTMNYDRSEGFQLAFQGPLDEKIVGSSGQGTIF
jgi:hypothetical protein